MCVGGGMYSFFARLSHLTIDQASLSRRSTVLTPNKRHLQQRALSVFFSYITKNKCMIVVMMYCVSTAVMR